MLTIFLDFDPSQLRRQRKSATDEAKLQTVRIMAPFSMKCLTCGEYIYKGRKFNARKDTRPNEKYYNITIIFFHIKCTRCSAEITLRTDPKNADYAMVKGALRNVEPWRNAESANETDAERLDRLEAENAAEDQAADDAMENLEAKTRDAQHEMAVADALDLLRMKNAARARAEIPSPGDLVQDAERLREEEKQDQLDSEEARQAFAKYKVAPIEIADDKMALSEITESPTLSDNGSSSVVADQSDMKPPPVPTGFPARKRKQKKDYAAALGLKSKSS